MLCGNCFLIPGDSEMYGRVLLMKLLTSDDDEVSLPSPVGEKFFSHQLEVNASVYF